MSIRAVICDVYGTLLSVAPGPPPETAEARWRELCRRYLGEGPPRGWDEFCQALELAIRREHARARVAGIPFPEVDWLGTVTEVLPELAGLGGEARDEFLFHQAQIWHRVGLMPGGAESLTCLRDSGVVLGIASNAQPYTLRELEEALRPAGVTWEHFASDLCFWSFAHGFSKPDPHVFRLLGARLRLRGIRPEETLMIGDRLDNDIEPARAQGWQAWRLATGSGARPDAGPDSGAMMGDWAALMAWWREIRVPRLSGPACGNGSRSCP